MCKERKRNIFIFKKKLLSKQNWEVFRKKIQFFLYLEKQIPHFQYHKFEKNIPWR
jgi:hypothetical protein